MNNKQLLKTDTDDLLAEVRHHNLYAIHYFFSDDVEDFYGVMKQFVAIKASGTHIDAKRFHEILRKVEKTNVYCGISRYAIRDLFRHSQNDSKSGYSNTIHELEESGQLIVREKGVLQTKTMEKPLHYTKRYFIPKFELEQYIANHGGSVKTALSQSRAELSPRVLKRFEKFIANQKNQRAESTSPSTLAEMQNKIEELQNMALTKEQSDAIDALCSNFAAELKEIVGGKEPQEQTAVFTADFRKKRETKRQAKPTATLMDDIPEIVEAETGRSKWVDTLEKKVPEWREKNVSPTFLNSLVEAFRLTVPRYGGENLPVGANGTCDAALQQQISVAILQAWYSRQFTLADVDTEKWNVLLERFKSRYA